MTDLKKIVYVDKDNCTSCNLCADTVPKYFQMDDEDLSETHLNGEMINNAPVESEDEQTVQDTIDECPGECIHWKE